MNIDLAKKRGRVRGFTLAEVMMAAGVGALVVTLTVAAALAVSRLYVRTGIKNSVSEDFRAFTRLLAEQGNQANGFYVFEGIHPSERRLCAAGESGDLVVFVYYGLNSIRTDPNRQSVARIIGFYREHAVGAAAASDAPSDIRWFDSAKHDWGHGISAAAPASIGSDGSGLARLLPVPASAAASAHAAAASVVGRFPVLARHTMGGATDADRTLRLFNNNDGRSICVSGFIVRTASSAGAATAPAGYRSQSAFNLTIAPRSAN